MCVVGGTCVLYNYIKKMAEIKLIFMNVRLDACFQTFQLLIAKLSTMQCMSAFPAGSAMLIEQCSCLLTK